MSVEIKICGITTEEAIEAAERAGIDWIGLVFFPPSPRNLSPERAAELTQFVEAAKVGLFVDPDDRLLDRVLSEVRLDLLQFHGHETPERLEAIRNEYGLPVMKAISVEGPADLALALPYVGIADRLLFDAKPPAGAKLPGGNAVSFDWTLMKGFHCPLPWMLAGGLTPGNVAQAIKESGASAVDASSGIESEPGIKDPAKIAAFVKAVRGGRSSGRRG